MKSGEKKPKGAVFFNLIDLGRIKLSEKTVQSAIYKLLSREREEGQLHC